MKSPMRLLAAIWVLMLVLIACGESASVGSEDLLDIEEQRNAERLGQRASPTPEPTEEAGGALALGEQASPTPEQPSPPPAEKKYFDIFLTSNPYYQGADGKYADHWRVPVGYILRVTNRDDTAERPFRTFTAEDGTFNSGRLTTGEQWETPLPRPGQWNIVDQCCPFIRGSLEVF